MTPFQTEEEEEELINCHGSECAAVAASALIHFASPHSRVCLYVYGHDWKPFRSKLSLPTHS